MNDAHIITTALDLFLFTLNSKNGFSENSRLQRKTTEPEFSFFNNI